MAINYNLCKLIAKTKIVLKGLINIIKIISLPHQELQRYKIILLQHCSRVDVSVSSPLLLSKWLSHYRSCPMFSDDCTLVLQKDDERFSDDQKSSRRLIEKEVYQQRVEEPAPDYSPPSPRATPSPQPVDTKKKIYQRTRSVSKSRTSCSH